MSRFSRGGPSCGDTSTATTAKRNGSHLEAIRRSNSAREEQARSGAAQLDDGIDPLLERARQFAEFSEESRLCGRCTLSRSSKRETAPPIKVRDKVSSVRYQLHTMSGLVPAFKNGTDNRLMAGLGLRKQCFSCTASRYHNKRIPASDQDTASHP